MAAIQEQLPKESLPEFPQTRLGKLVIAWAEEARETGILILPIKQSDVESYHDDVKTILIHCGYMEKGDIWPSKKPHRNLVSAICEVLYYYDPGFHEEFLLILKEIPEQKKQRKPYKPWVPTHLKSVTVIHRNLLKVDPGPDAPCVIESVGKKSSLYRLKKEALSLVKA